MALSRRTHLHLLVGLLISAAAVYLSLRKIDFTALGSSLKAVNLLYLLPAIGGQLACWLLKGFGWRFLIYPAKKTITVRTTTTILLIGLMINNFFPAKMGELARAYVLGEKEKLPKSLCLSTIFMEHLLDILVLSLFLLLLLPTVDLPLWLRTSGGVVGFSALGLIVLLFIVMHREEKFSRWVSGLLIHVPERFRGKVQHILDNVFQGMRVVTGRYIFYAFACLLGMWMLAFLTTHLVLIACGIFLPIQAAVMVIVFCAFGKIIPSSPGSIGTFHYLVIVVLMSFQVSKEEALGAALILHALTFLMEGALGIVALLASNLSLGKLTRAEASP
jgi:glycosyltransferase 2 family protein